MTNKQIAAKLLHNSMVVLKQQITNLANHSIAEIADKSRILDKGAQEIRDKAHEMLQPIIDRMAKLMTPRKDKAGKDAEDSDQPEATGD